MIKINKILKSSAALALGLLPFIALAQNKVSEGLTSSAFGFSNLFGSGGLTGAMTVQDLIQKVVELLLILAGGIAVLFVIIGGYQYLTSAGNEEQAEKGKKTLINAIIGIIVVVMSFVIINVIVNLVSGTGGFWIF